MIDRINACEANLLSLVRIVDDMQKEINTLRQVNEQQNIALAELNAWMERFDDRLNLVEGIVVP